MLGSVSGTIFYTGLYPGFNNDLASTMGLISPRSLLCIPMLLISSIISTRTLEVGLLGRNTPWLLKDQKIQTPSRSKFSSSLTRTTCRRLVSDTTATERYPLHTSPNSPSISSDRYREETIAYLTRLAFKFKFNQPYCNPSLLPRINCTVLLQLFLHTKFLDIFCIH